MGRWTKFLLPLCRNYVGIDIASECVQGCQEIFADVPYGRFVTNDGYSLSEVENNSIDLVFSFDSLVHAEFDVFESYIPQILRKLNRDGVAFIHHSNIGAFGTGFPNPGGRTFSVSRQNIEDLIALSGGVVLIQEVIGWPYGPGNFARDCLTIFTRDNGRQSDPVHLYNLRFAEESEIIRDFQSPYSRITNRVE